MLNVIKLIMTSNTLGIVELFHPQIHGENDNIKNNYLFMYGIKSKYFLNSKTFVNLSLLSMGENDCNCETCHEEDNDIFKSITKNKFPFEIIKKDLKCYRQQFNDYLKNNILENHPSIRNYKNIITKPSYMNIEIVQKKLLETGETIAIIKTCWLKIFQRKIRSVINKKKV